MKHVSRTSVTTAVLAVSMMMPLFAQPVPPGQDLAQVTLEDLMKVRVTSAARKSQRADDVPAAVYVITRNDIQRSGLNTLPELLRLVPGVQVAQVNANKWAVSIRGFNDLYSNKLLVLVDGRSVYTRTFSGVFWDMQDLMISDIDRIEVIRGPGGAVWGANAVNGVINVITRPAAETQGLSANVSAGTFERERAGIRYGGTLGGASYRVFSQWSGYGDAPQPAQTVFEDGWHSLTNGFRIDGSRGPDAVLAQGHFTTNQTRPGWMVLPSLELGVPPTTDGIAHAREASVLGLWTRTRIDGTVIQVQGYYTDTHRDEGIAEFSERTSDVDSECFGCSAAVGPGSGGGAVMRRWCRS
jgi:iron complex outermembrane receptor protein